MTTETAPPIVEGTPAPAAVSNPAPAAPAAAPAPAAPAEPVAAPAPAEPAAAPAPAGAPEAYEFSAPEGQTFNETVLATFGETARSLNLSQEAAQKILSEVAPAIQASQMQALSEFYADIGGMPDTWAATVAADKELGGPALEENLAVAKKARDLGGPALNALLDKTGLGNHPEVIRWAYKIGKSLSEDNFISGGSGGSTTNDAASKLYGPK